MHTLNKTKGGTCEASPVSRQRALEAGMPQEPLGHGVNEPQMPTQLASRRSKVTLPELATKTLVRLHPWYQGRRKSTAAFM